MDRATSARAGGARVVTHEFVPIVEEVRNVIGHQASGTWVLVVDPDERVSPGSPPSCDGSPPASTWTPSCSRE